MPQQCAAPSPLQRSLRRTATSLARGLREGLKWADDACASIAGGAPPQGGSLVTLLYHELYLDVPQLRHPGLAPNQNTTVADFARFLGVMVEGGYLPVTPNEVAAGLAPGGHYFMVTFDDGYFNNTLALDVLARLHVPATFFVTSSPVLEGKAFWWDALARELRKRGSSETDIRTQLRAMKRLDPKDIETRLRAAFGAQVLRPRGDLDRPFTPAELRDFAANRWVHIGNHTSDHAILPRCDHAAMRQQIGEGQEALASMTGRRPVAIAYPNGDYSDAVVDAAVAEGLRLGVTVRPLHRAAPRPESRECMTLGRYLVAGSEDPRLQYRKINSSFVPGHMIKSFLASPA